MTLVERDADADLQIEVDPGATWSPPGRPVVVIGASRAHGSLLAEPLPCALLPSDPTSAELALALRAVASGFSIAAPGVWLGAASAQSPANDAELTPREEDVLALLGTGLTNKGIAARLGMSENTVKFHVAAILSKLGAQSRAEAVFLAARQGLLPL